MTILIWKQCCTFICFNHFVFVMWCDTFTNTDTTNQINDSIITKRLWIMRFISSMRIIKKIKGKKQKSHFFFYLLINLQKVNWKGVALKLKVWQYFHPANNFLAHYFLTWHSSPMFQPLFMSIWTQRRERGVGAKYN